MGELAVVGSLSKPLPPINAFDFAFSQPFLRNSDVLKNARTKQQQEHHIPPIPPSKPIFVDAITGATLSWKGVRDEACKLAVGLRQRLYAEQGPYETVSPVVLVHLPNSIHFISIVLGIFAAGYTASLASPMLTPTELQHIISLAKPAAIITTWDGYKNILPALDRVEDKALFTKLTTSGRIFIHDRASNATIHNRLSKVESYNHSAKHVKCIDDLLLHVPYDFTAAEITEDTFRNHTALILWSSGTTGKSKGVRLSHEAIIANTISLWHVAQHYDANERWLGFVPFYHIYGFAVVAVAAPSCGATVHCMPKFDANLMLDLIEKEKITCIHLAPPVALLLAKSPMVEGRDCSSVRFALSGGAPLGPDVIEMVYKRLGFTVFMGYGLSEGGSVTQQYANTFKELTPHLGNSGWPHQGIVLKIISIEDPTKVVKMGEEGEIVVQGPGNMIGYLNNPEATNEVLDKDRWYRTGDVGKIDNTGALWITDRIKEMIKVKGLQVSPGDLEAILCASDHIADAGVVATYDPATASEYPRAYLVPSDPKLVALCVPQEKAPMALLKLGEEVKAWMETRSAKYKWLKGGVVFVQQIPKSPSGKILRRMLKDTKGVEVQLYTETRRVPSKL